MAIDRLAGKVPVKTRDQVRDRYLKDWKVRQPAADTSDKSQPYLFASNFADGQMPMYAQARAYGDATSHLTARGKDLDYEGESRGRPRNPAVGAAGYVVCSTGSGGSNVVENDELKYLPKNLRFRVIASGPVSNGGLVAIVGISTGPGTNLPPGAELTWVTPRPGMNAKATVFENTDGSGLSGGAEEETDEDYQAALAELVANPPQAGNEAEVVTFCERIKGIALQKAFVIPAALGPGTKQVCFTMRPATPGGSRQPNGAHLALVEAALKDKFPGDDGILVSTGLDQSVVVVLKVTWKSGTPGWLDQGTWPAFATPRVAVDNAVPITATAFRATTSVNTTTPAVGKTVALYDAANGRFVPKRIKTVAVVVASRSWDLTFETTTPGMDAVFVPTNGAVISPWSESMNSVVEPVLAYMDKQGPGEINGYGDDPGRRKRRWPPPEPDRWPSNVENRLLDDVFSFVADAVIASPSTPFQTQQGVAGATHYLHRLTDLAVFPQ